MQGQANLAGKEQRADAVQVSSMSQGPAICTDTVRVSRMPQEPVICTYKSTEPSVAPSGPAATTKVHEIAIARRHQALQSVANSVHKPVSQQVCFHCNGQNVAQFLSSLQNSANVDSVHTLPATTSVTDSMPGGNTDACGRMLPSMEASHAFGSMDSTNAVSSSKQNSLTNIEANAGDTLVSQQVYSPFCVDLHDCSSINHSAASTSELSVSISPRMAAMRNSTTSSFPHGNSNEHGALNFLYAMGEHIKALTPELSTAAPQMQFMPKSMVIIQAASTEVHDVLTSAQIRALLPDINSASNTFIPAAGHQTPLIGRKMLALDHLG